jgi:hypothetical protein
LPPPQAWLENSSHDHWQKLQGAESYLVVCLWLLDACCWLRVAVCNQQQPQLTADSIIRKRAYLLQRLAPPEHRTAKYISHSHGNQTGYRRYLKG